MTKRDLVVAVDVFQQTFRISCGEAFVNGHTTYGGEIFFVYVPPKDRRQGIAKILLRRAIKLLKDEYGYSKPAITNPSSPEGRGLVEWFRELIKDGK